MRAPTHRIDSTRHTQTHARSGRSRLDGRTDVFCWDGVDVGTKNQCDDDGNEEDGGAVSQEACRRFHY
jgi:hypothetical protein